MNSSQIFEWGAGGGKKLENFSFMTSAENAGELISAMLVITARARVIRNSFCFIGGLPPFEI
jgi:hypothetical protein